MSDEVTGKIITIWNKGRRTYTGIETATGELKDLPPGEHLEVVEVVGLRLAAAYPRDIGNVAPARGGMDADELRRKEQSLNDRKTALDAREKKLDEREAALVVKENAAAVAEGAPDITDFMADEEKVVGPGKKSKKG